jgi:hypothetical protein
LRYAVANDAVANDRNRFKPTRHHASPMICSIYQRGWRNDVPLARSQFSFQSRHYLATLIREALLSCERSSWNPVSGMVDVFLKVRKQWEI